MLHFIKSSDKTNSCYITEWELTSEPFKAYRGACNGRYKCFFPIDNKNGFDPNMPVVVKEIGLKKTKILANGQSDCGNYAFISATSGFRGGIGEFSPKNGAEIVYQNSGSLHCVEHILALAKMPQGSYIVSKFGRRSSYGEVELFGYNGRLVRMSDEEWEIISENDEQIQDVLKNGLDQNRSKHKC